MLTKGNIQTITETVDKAEISFSHLRADLIDHICCQIEEEMQQGLDFQNAYVRINKSTGINSLQKVQEKTLLLIDKKYCAMKKTMHVSGIASTSMLMLATIFKIFHFPGASIMLLLGFFTLCFFFLPSANYVMAKESKRKGMLVLYLSAFLGSFGFFLGVLFKMMHWPGANWMLLIGIAVLGLVFLPLLLIYQYGSDIDKKAKRINIIAIISGMIYLYGFLSKMMHWPGAAILLSVGSLGIVLLFIPSYTFYHYKNEKYIKLSYIYFIAVIAWFVLFTSLVSLSVSPDILNAYVFQNNSIKVTTSVLELQNQTIVSSNMHTANADKVKKVSALSEDLVTYIESLKIDVVKAHNSENNVAIENNTLHPEKIINKGNNSVPGMVLLGQNKDGKAFTLKKKIDETRNELIMVMSGSQNAKSLIDNLLGTDNNLSIHGEPHSWEFYNFSQSSVIGCINVLTALQLRVRTAENEALNTLLANTSKL